MRCALGTKKKTEGVWYFIFAFTVTFLFGAIIGNFITTPESPNTTISTPSTRQVVHTWTKADSKAYAHDALEAWTAKQFSCLNKLWSNESAWNHKALNPVKVMGKNAGGIPQLLGLSPLTPPTIQIDRGLSYVYFRYSTICKAWQHFQEHNWY